MSKNAFANILAAMNKSSENGFQREDESAYWKAELDKAGNGYAVIRFLPAKTDDQLPFVKLFNHGFQGPTGKWFIEDCPTTIGQNCPVCESNGPLWNSGKESDKEIVRKRKRKTTYISNVLVVSDPKNPDNEGKVFMFKYGKKIYDKIKDVMMPPPEFADEVPMNPFDLEEGANFKLKIRKVEGYANFDKSEFDAPSSVKVDMSQIHDLAGFIDPSKFKSYEDLDKKMKNILGGNAGYTSKASSNNESDDESFEQVDKKARPAPAKDESDDDDLNYFKSLAMDD